MTEKGRFLCPSEFNGRSLSAVDQSQNLLGTTSRIWATLSLCLRSIALTVFDSFCSQNLVKLYFFYVLLNRNLVLCDRSTNTNTCYDLDHNIAVILVYVSDL